MNFFLLQCPLLPPLIIILVHKHLHSQLSVFCCSSSPKNICLGIIDCWDHLESNRPRDPSDNSIHLRSLPENMQRGQ